MTDAAPAIPADDPARALALVHADDPGPPHLAIVGDTDTVLVSGAGTAGRLGLIDMLIPPGGGPAPHRHDFEETFIILAGEPTLAFRSETSTAGAGTTVNIPANAPHQSRNASGAPVRLLCPCAPAGQKAFFAAIGQPVASRTAPAPAPAPALDEAAMRAFGEKAAALAPQHRTEPLRP